MGRPYTEKRKENNARWDAENLKRFSVAFPVALYDAARARADERGESINGYFKSLVRADLGGEELTHPARPEPETEQSAPAGGDLITDEDRERRRELIERLRAKYPDK